MKKIIALAGSASVAAGMAMTSAAVASAGPDLNAIVGAQYGEAKKQISDAGVTPIVRTRVGDKVREDKCIIENIQLAPANSKQVYVSLNCYANVASQTSPGFSQQSQMARAAKEAQEEAEAQQQAESEGSVTASNPR